MNLAWILLLAQMSPALPMKGRIVCWRNLEHKVVCINSAGEYVPVPIRENPPQPEPMDVPAVQDSKKVFAGYAWDIDPNGGPLVNRAVYTTETVSSCADKTRVLLTSEDGKKHCIKFPGE